MSFLSKYGPLAGSGANVVPLREYLVELIQLSLRKSHSGTSLNDFKEAIIQHNEEQEMELDAKKQEIIAVAIFARREELSKVLTELILQKSVDSYLVDYNYNIEVRQQNLYTDH